MDATTREFVTRRAAHRCEYCHTPQAAAPFIPFHIDHVVAKQHLTDDTVQNLALACDRCNLFKGSNLASVDPANGIVVLLFHPRNDVWSAHFHFDGATIIGRTPSGRATVRLLEMNAPRRLELREEWLAEGNKLD
jgi:hypothetical protein